MKLTELIEHLKRFEDMDADANVAIQITGAGGRVLGVARGIDGIALAFTGPNGDGDAQTGTTVMLQAHGGRTGGDGDGD